MADIEVRDRPRALEVTAGDTITLRLSENPTTGYRWFWAVTGAAIEASYDEFSAGPASRPGAGGERVIVLRAVAAGRASVLLRLARAWEGASAVQAWAVEVTVRDVAAG
jgi:inhibitor of cysteine peptidase